MTSTNTRERFADVRNGGELRLGELQSKTYLVLIPIDDMTVEQGSLEILFRQKRRVNDDAVVA